MEVDFIAPFLTFCTLNHTPTVYIAGMVNISCHVSKTCFFWYSSASSFARLLPETELLFCFWLMLMLCNGLWPPMCRIMILFCTLRWRLLTPDIYTKPLLCTLARRCRKTSTNPRLITTTVQRSRPHLSHAFPDETSSFKRNMWKHSVDYCTLESRVDPFENQLVWVIIEAYWLASRQMRPIIHLWFSALNTNLL